SVTLSGTELFDQAIATVLGAGAHSAYAVHEPSEGLYKLYVYNGSADTVKFYFKGTGGCAHVFDSADVAFAGIQCTREALGDFAGGYIGNFTFVATVSWNSGAGSCTMLGWNDAIETNDYGQHKLKDCIPCT